MNQEDAARMARSAMTWGAITWIGNIAGCLLGTIPLALPLTLASTVVTLISGFFAMGLGVRAATATDDPDARRDAWWGYMLGLSHLLIVAVVTLLVLLAWYVGLVERALHE